MSLPDLVARASHAVATHKLLSFACAVLLVEIALRSLAPRSRLYAGWKATFEAIGSVWTAVLLGVVYVFPVGPIGLVMRVFGNDPLDRGLAPEPSFWRTHEENPLGPERAARHQF